VSGFEIPRIEPWNPTPSTALQGTLLRKNAQGWGTRQLAATWHPNLRLAEAHVASKDLDEAYALARLDISVA